MSVLDTFFIDVYPIWEGFLMPENLKSIGFTEAIITFVEKSLLDVGIDSSSILEAILDAFRTQKPFQILEKTD